MRAAGQIAGLFAQYLPHPTTLVFEAYLAVLLVAGLGLRFVPETVLPRRRPTFRFAGLGIPDRGRGEFAAAAVAAFAAFALLGLFSSLVPGFVGGHNGPALGRDGRWRGGRGCGLPWQPGLRQPAAVLTFSLLLAALCLFSLLRIATDAAADTGISQ